MIAFQIYCVTLLQLIPTIASFSGIYDVSKVTNCPDCKVFPSSSNYTDFNVIYRNKSKPEFFVGARNGILQMTIDAQFDHFISVPGDPQDKEKCLTKSKKMRDENGCGNIITLIIPFGTSLMLACGTNADQREFCWKTSESGVQGKPAFYLFHRYPQVKYVVSGEYIYQGWEDADSKEGEIMKSLIYSQTSKLELKLTNSDNHFVSIYEFGNFVYFFFSDVSDEVPDKNSKVIYARVGRMCKYDRGGKTNVPSHTEIHTFSKARLLCPAKANGETVHYNYLELTSTITDDDGNVFIYGLFRGPNPTDSQYALCRYSLTEIEAAFEDRKYYDIKKNPYSWQIVNAESGDLRHETCDDSLDTTTIEHSQYERYKTRLTHVSTVVPDGKQAVIVRSHKKSVKKLLADTVVIANTSYDVVRLFDSNLICEMFVRVSSIGNEAMETYLTVRKISEEPLTVNDVALIKQETSDENSVPTSSAMPTTPTTNTPSISTTSNSASTTPNLTSTQAPTTIHTSSTNMSQNSTQDRDGASFGNASTTSVGVTASPLRRKQMAPDALPTSSPTSMSDSSIQDPVDSTKTIIVVAQKHIVAVPVASCHVHSTCRDCVAAKNPYCAWKGKCVQLMFNETGAYIQDIEKGDYSKVCPPVDVSCELVKVGKMIPKEQLSLQCSPSGIPTPQVSKWTKNNDVLSNQSDSGFTMSGHQLTISSYTLNSTGKYTCHVSNDLTSHSCSFDIQGSKPKIECSVINKIWLQCKVVGYPEPEVLFQAGKNRYPGKTKIEMKAKGRYELIAYNSFGAETGGVYEVLGKSLDFKIIDMAWHEDLSNTKSQKYMDLKKKILDGIKQLYKDNNLFLGVILVSLRKGSVVATVELSSLKTPNSKESNLTRELEEVMQGKGKLGDLSISKVDDNKGSSDQQSTPAPSRAPSTRDVISSPPQGKQTSLPTENIRLSTRFSSTRLPASTRLPSTPNTELPSRTVTVLGTKPVAQSSSSSGVAVWLLIVLLILIGLLVFVVGYFCGFRGLLFSKCHSSSRRSKSDSLCSEEDGTEPKGMSRSDKGRESEMKLLRKHEGKRQSPAKKNSPKKNNHEHTNNRPGSVEIQKHYEDDDRPNSNQSIC